MILFVGSLLAHDNTVLLSSQCLFDQYCGLVSLRSIAFSSILAYVAFRYLALEASRAGLLVINKFLNYGRYKDVK